MRSLIPECEFEYRRQVRVDERWRRGKGLRGGGLADEKQSRRCGAVRCGAVQEFQCRVAFGTSKLEEEEVEEEDEGRRAL